VIVINISGAIQESEIEVFIDQIPTKFTLRQNKIEIESDLDFGLHQLRINSFAYKRWQISNITVNDSSLRKLLYLSWACSNTTSHIQPCTEFWEPGMSWILPFGYPVSHWVSLVESKIPNGEYGKDLTKNYFIWYPDRVQIQGAFPQIVKDFFWHNFDFVVVDKNQMDLKKIPYMQYKNAISDELITLATGDINNNLNIIQQGVTSYSGHLAEFDSYTDQHEWKNIPLKKENGTCCNVMQLPHVWKLLDSLNLSVLYAFIGVLPAGGFLYPHKDDVHDLTPATTGCKLLHIPLQWPAGNWLKLSGNKALNLADTGAMIINNNYFTHAIVNTSDRPRYTLILRTDSLIYNHCEIARYADPYINKNMQRRVLPTSDQTDA